MRLLRPEFFERDGEEAGIGERKGAGAGVEQDAALKIFAALVGEAAQAGAVGVVERGGGFDFHAPGVAAARDDQSNLDLVLSR